MGIDERAIVGKSAIIGEGVDIGPFAVVEDGAEIASGVKIWPHAYICNGAYIGKDTAIHMGAVVGHHPQDLVFTNKKSFTKIGERCVIREYVTIHRGTKEGTTTSVGNDCYLMAVSHVGHNCQIGNNVIVANNALLAGYVIVEDNAFISGNVSIHQFCRIGKLSMIGGFTGINKDVPPFMLVRGPSMVRSINLVGLRRAKFSKESFASIKEAFKILYMSELNTTQAMEKMKGLNQTPELTHLLNFITNSKRGICSARSNTEDFFD